MKIFAPLSGIRFVGAIFLSMTPVITQGELYSSTFQTDRNEIRAIDAHPLEPKVAICSTEGIYLYDATTNETEEVSPLNCATVTWTNANTLMAVDSKTGSLINVLSPDLNALQLPSYPLAPATNYYFQWSQDKKILVNGVQGYRFWQVDTGVLVYRLNQAPRGLFSLSPDGSLLAITREPEMGIEIWDVATDTLLAVLAEDMYIGQSAWSPDGQYLALQQIYAPPTPNIWIWDVEKNTSYNKLTYTFDEEEYIYGQVEAITWSKGGDEITTAIYLGGSTTFSTSVAIWNIHNGTITEQFLDIPGTIYPLSWGNLLAAHDSLNEELYIWQLDRSSQPKVISLDDLTSAR